MAMMWLIFGLLLWTLVHWVPALWPALKTRWRNRLGAGGYQGSFALLVFAGLLLIVLGWRQTNPIQPTLAKTRSSFCESMAHMAPIPHAMLSHQ